MHTFYKKTPSQVRDVRTILNNNSSIGCKKQQVNLKASFNYLVEQYERKYGKYEQS